MQIQRYRVTGHCAHASTRGNSGRVRQLFFKGQLLPEDTPEREIQHLLAVKLIQPVGESPQPQPQPVKVDEAPRTEPVKPAVGDGGSADGGSAEGEAGLQAGSTEGDSGLQPEGNTDPDPELEAKREAARAKLPADGSRPDGRAAQAVWVEWLVGKGYSYEAVAKEPKATLMDLANTIE